MEAAEPVKMPRTPRAGGQPAPSPRRQPVSPYKEDPDKAHMLAILATYKFENYMDQLYPEGFATAAPAADGKSPRSPTRASQKSVRAAEPPAPQAAATTPRPTATGMETPGGGRRRVRNHVEVQTDSSEFYDLRALMGTLDFTQAELSKLQNDVEDIELRVKVDLVKKLDDELDKAHMTALDRIQFLEGRQFRQLEQVRQAYRQHMANVIARMKYEQRVFQERLQKDMEAKAAEDRRELTAKVDELTFQLRKTESIDEQLREKVAAQATLIHSLKSEIEAGEHSQARKAQERLIAELQAKLEAATRSAAEERVRAARNLAEQAQRYDGMVTDLRMKGTLAEAKHGEAVAKTQAEGRQQMEAAERAWAAERERYERQAAEAARESALQNILNSRQAAAMQKLAQENVALQASGRPSPLSPPPIRTPDADLDLGTPETPAWTFGSISSNLIAPPSPAAD
eukprot:tig00000158_g10187.t1